MRAQNSQLTDEIQSTDEDSGVIQFVPCLAYLRYNKFKPYSRYLTMSVVRKTACCMPPKLLPLKEEFCQKCLCKNYPMIPRNGFKNTMKTGHDHFVAQFCLLAHPTNHISGLSHDAKAYDVSDAQILNFNWLVLELVVCDLAYLDESEPLSAWKLESSALTITLLHTALLVSAVVLLQVSVDCQQQHITNIETTYPVQPIMPVY